MKLGILTFHSQLNYGGVLQCWALKTALERMGHEVVVVDRWLTSDNAMLDGPFGHAGWKGWLSITVKSMLGCGQWRQVVRHWRTRRFVRNLGLTPFHFHEWKDAPQDLGIDCLVVGSDQVWHGGDWGYPDPRAYLLEGAPVVRAIAYAASFGMKSLPDGTDYRAGFQRFAAISVRESEGIDLVKSQGAKATHVVDPTLLLEPAGWAKMGRWKKVPRRIVCYFLSQNVMDAVKILEPWARKNNYTVEIVCNSLLKVCPGTVRELAGRLVDMVDAAVVPSRVHIRTGYGPKEFVRAFAQAEMCITDSFHAVMFSSIYNCNVRFLHPQSADRRAMFARIEEFAQKCIEGNFLVDNVEQALQSFGRDEKVSFDAGRITAMRTTSQKWLENALKG